MSWPFPLPVPWAVAGRELVNVPGEWRHVASYFSRQSARVTASAIRCGKLRCLAALGRFEARHRVVDGEFRVYVRYLGPVSTSPETGPGRFAEGYPHYATHPDGECNAHGAHPHAGMTCLDCAACRPAESTKDEERTEGGA
jgi:hypothetical protein